MPVTMVRSVHIAYVTLGDRGPWVALTTGGRRGHQEFLSFARKLAARGFRVLLHDRRNTGASDVVIDGDESDEILCTDDLHSLLGQLGALPAFIGGSSSGARLSMRFYLRHPEAVKALLLMRITGGAFAAERLPENYYGQFIQAARQGGMAAVCETEHYRGVLAANPSNRERLLSMDPKRFIEVMSGWRDAFMSGTHLPVMGLSEAELASIRVPTVVVPGNDKTHSSASGRIAHRCIPGSRLHELPLEDQDVPLLAFEDWAPHEAELAQVFADFINRVETQSA
jgi:pimeloyl-ACP methyl ester carboxylesterase